MDRRDTVLSLVQDLLAAPGSEAGWSGFLTHLCDSLQGIGANFISHTLASNDCHLSITARTPTEAASAYQQHWHQFDPWANSSRKVHLFPGDVVTGDQLITRNEFIRGAFYNDFGARFEIAQCLAGVLEASPQTVSVVSVNRTERVRFDAEDAALLTAIMPPLQRALEVHRRLTGAELTAANASAVLDRLPQGVLLISAQGVVLSTNRAAETILRARDGLTSDHGELRASTIALTNRLREALDAAVGTSQGIGVDARNTGLALPCPSGRRPLSIMIAPLPRSRAALVSDGAVAVVFVTDPDRSPIPDAAIIRAAFGLTSAESELVQRLISGSTLEHAAAQLRVCVETVRKRLKIIFEKTNTHRQAELVRLVLISIAVP